MNKKLYLIGNFKMNSSMSEILPYLKSIKKNAKDTENVVGICVPNLYLPYVSKKLKNSKVLFGAQNVHYKSNGAFTGEVSVEMLNDFDTKLVIIGHSERRTYYNETDESVNLKLLKVLDSSILPIVCVGETLSQRENGETIQVIDRQVSAALNNVDKEKISKLIFAYEPIWAIGTGKTATKEEAESVISHIKEYIIKKYSLTSNYNLIVLYGGSMNEKNAVELLSMPSIDGGLIGGACLNVDKFSTIFNSKVEK